MAKLPPHMLAAGLKANAERSLCKDWLLDIMRIFSKKDAHQG